MSVFGVCYRLVWLSEANPLLGSEATEQIDAAFQADKLVVSAISFWEVAMLVSKGRSRKEAYPHQIDQKRIEERYRLGEGYALEQTYSLTVLAFWPLQHELGLSQSMRCGCLLSVFGCLLSAYTLALC